MKKDEAVIIAKEKAVVMIEYLESFLTDEDVVSGKMDFSSSNSILVVDMFVNKKVGNGVDRHFNLGMSSVYADLLIEEMMGLFLEKFVPSEKLGVSPYASIRSGFMVGAFMANRDGVYVYNDNHAQIDVNFWCHGEKYAEIMHRFNDKVDEYANSEGAIKFNV